MNRNKWPKPTQPRTWNSRSHQSRRCQVKCQKNLEKSFKIETIALVYHWSTIFVWHFRPKWPFGLHSNSFPGIFRVETFTKNLAVQCGSHYRAVQQSVCVMKWGGEDNQRPTTDFYLYYGRRCAPLGVLKVKSQCFWGSRPYQTWSSSLSYW